ncbi:UNVERIFIED_CONTAM: hypothetical protein FKN15_035050 [Acipenser sinensis]
MNEIGKKPHCLIVHQNVRDVSACEKHKGQETPLEQLNEMTEAAVRMENKHPQKIHRCHAVRCRGIIDISLVCGMDSTKSTCFTYCNGLYCTS